MTEEETGYKGLSARDILEYSPEGSIGEVARQQLLARQALEESDDQPGLFSDTYNTILEHAQKNNRFKRLGPEYQKRVLGYSWRRSCARCEPPPHLNSVRILVLLISNSLISILFWVGVIYKAFNDSTLDYLQHFTNWMWTFGAVWYTLDVISMLMITRFAEFMNLFVLWWIYFSNVWVVFWLVFIMLYDNATILTDEFEENGGDYSAGTVLVGDRIFHVIPAVYSLWNLILRIPDFIDIYNNAMIPRRLRYKYTYSLQIEVQYRVYYYMIMIVAGSSMIILTYYNFFNINEVYNVGTNVWIGLLVIFSTIVLCTVGPIIILSPLGKRSRQAKPDTWTRAPFTASERDKTLFFKDMRNSVNVANR